MPLYFHRLSSFKGIYVSQWQGLCTWKPVLILNVTFDFDNDVLPMMSLLCTRSYESLKTPVSNLPKARPGSRVGSSYIIMYWKLIKLWFRVTIVKLRGFWQMSKSALRWWGVLCSFRQLMLMLVWLFVISCDLWCYISFQQVHLMLSNFALLMRFWCIYIFFPERCQTMLW